MRDKDRKKEDWRPNEHHSHETEWYDPFKVVMSERRERPEQNKPAAGTGSHDVCSRRRDKGNFCHKIRDRHSDASDRAIPVVTDISIAQEPTKLQRHDEPLNNEKQLRGSHVEPTNVVQVHDALLEISCKTGCKWIFSITLSM